MYLVGSPCTYIELQQDEDSRMLRTLDVESIGSSEPTNCGKELAARSCACIAHLIAQSVIKRCVDSECVCVELPLLPPLVLLERD